MKWGVLPVALLVMGTLAMAQNTTSDAQNSGPTASSTATSKTDPSVGQRKENQQDRIANGVQSGQLTSGETSKLESKEAVINGETKADRAANGGKLTSTEKSQINNQQNQVSKQIYQDKHNASTAKYGNSAVGQRRENQQDRVANGIRSGQLTAGETTKLENQQHAITKQVSTDRAANGGKLTTAEKKQVNHEQNQASRNIYNKKHNATTQGSVKK